MNDFDDLIRIFLKAGATVTLVPDESNKKRIIIGPPEGVDGFLLAPKRYYLDIFFEDDRLTGMTIDQAPEIPHNMAPTKALHNLGKK